MAITTTQSWMASLDGSLVVTDKLSDEDCPADSQSSFKKELLKCSCALTILKRV